MLSMQELVKGKGIDPGLAAMDDKEPHQGDQHEEAAAEGKEHKLDRGIDFSVMPPDADEEKHGNELDFPEQIEEQQIGGHKEAHEAAFQE